MRAADWRALGVSLFAVVSLAACDAGGATGPAEVVSSTETPGTPAPRRSADQPFYQGVYLGDALTTPERVASALSEFGAMAGQRPTLVKSFHNLDADLSSTGWAGRLVREIDRASATNFVALDLNWSGRSGQLLDAINSGAADAAIARTARSIADVGDVVLLELAWEMNGNWNYAWQGTENSNAPAKYVAAWRRVVGIFRTEGATNVRFVFNPNTGNAVAPGSPGSAHWNWWRNYYPGDNYVDYVGGHGYNGPATFNAPYHDYNSLFFGRDSDGMIAGMAAQMPNKPIILGEIGMEENPRKAEWIRDAYTKMLGDSRIAGAVWFNMNKEADWRIQSNAAALAAYREVMTTNTIATAYAEPAAMRTTAVALQ